jgi:integrase
MKNRTNSVLRLNAKTTTHLQPGQIPSDQSPGQRSQLEKLKPELGRWYFVFCLMQVSGSRINEILKASHQQISNEGGLHIKGAKGSKDRYVYDFQCAQYLLKMKNLSTDPFLHLNIFAAIRLMKRYGMYTQKKGRKHMTITGIFRNEKAKNVRNTSKDEALTAAVLGHKSQNSTAYYGKD